MDTIKQRTTAEQQAQVADLLPGWPVLALLWGFPIFWLMGATVITGVLLAIVMWMYLAYYRAARFVPGVYAFIAFVVWVPASALMIDTGSRMMGFAYRYSILVIVATALVYAISAGRRLTSRSIINALTFVWFFAIAGGMAAMAWPRVRLSTPVGMLLPSSLTGNEYVRDLFFPPLAEVQSPYGAPTDLLRPAAPFPYANSWGVAIVLLTPVAIASFMIARSMIGRIAIVVGMAAMMVPAMATSNRAMFAGFAVSAVYMLIRLAARNRAAPVIALGSAGLIAAALLIMSGLLASIQQRQEYGSSNTRFTLYQETISRTMDSPILGFGAPRPSFDNIVSVGTQGYLWTVMFSYGLVGLTLFLAFLWGNTWRTWAARGDVGVALHSVLIVASIIIVVYGLDVMQMLTVALVVVVLLRDRYGLEHAHDRR